jgi:hypothetical protein
MSVITRSLTAIVTFGLFGSMVFGYMTHDSTEQANVKMVGTSSVGTVQEPEEDEPGFDCRIHGNKICGPDLWVGLGTPGEPMEDEPGFDCHIHGNKICGSDLEVKPEPMEDEPTFSCQVHGNRICGPNSVVEAGCYRGGELVIPWTRYDLDEYGKPSNDPLWGQVDSPC